MALNTIDELNALHLDVLKEIGNIGSGNAASSLSTLINCTTDISVPEVKLLDFSNAVNYLGDPDSIGIGMLVNLVEDIKGMMLYIIKKDAASTMTKAIFGTEIEDVFNLNEMERSFIAEVGNIMSASYINAIASLTGLTVDITVPQMTVDMVGAILSVPAVQFAQIGNKVLFINDNFIIGGSEVASSVILVPEMASLELLFKKLGVES